MIIIYVARGHSLSENSGQLFNESDLLTDFQKIVKISYSYATFILLYPNYLDKEIYS